jgi:mono/diheme cytochrome c family protein
MRIEKAAVRGQAKALGRARSAAVLLAIACWMARPALSADEAVSAEAAAAAMETYRTRCVLCHGETGKGDGAGALALDPKPRDMSDPAWQAAVTDEYVERIIARGGVAVGKSPSMPPNPDLQSKPEIVRALRHLVRGFARK